MHTPIHHTRGHAGTGRVLALGAVLALCIHPAASAQPGSLPFGPGEACVYRGSSALGRIGSGTMAVDAGGAVEGRETYLLRFDFRGRVGVFTVSDQTRSWFDPAALASYRFTKRERSPITSRNDDVRMDAAGRRWDSPRGEGGAMATDAPLDELSFIYFIRTLALADGDVYRLTRHYDPRRNPVTVRVTGRGVTRVPAGEYRTVQVEMRVIDPARYRGEGIVRLHLTDDARRVPVRIESSIPRAGRMVLALEAGGGACAAPAPQLTMH
ncbi:MAG TPA: DUF3108 domain-containing protein [Longimicrobiaceae bacterium]|nr:DUF3108 domain-containing protein [Longimicrobiaceae bacterium]